MGDVRATIASLTEASPIYLDDFTDEVLPCLPNLRAWAAWLADPPEEDRHWAPDAKDGDVFGASCLIHLGDIRVEWGDGGFQAAEPVPEGTEFYFKRHYPGSTGWDAEFAADTLTDACDCLDEGDGPLWFACVKNGPDFKVRFVAATGDQPARLEVVDYAS